MADASFDLKVDNGQTRLNQVIARVVDLYSRRNPDCLDLISVRTVCIDGELHKRVSSESAALIKDIRDLCRSAGGINV
ncbi:MAG: hypothetical protein AAFO63_00595 [Pseudomonadota bacterium]